MNASVGGVLQLHVMFIKLFQSGKPHYSVLIVVLNNDFIITYELHTTLKTCNMYIKPAFEQTKSTPPYTIEVRAECYNEKAKRSVLEGAAYARPKDCERSY